MKVLIIGSGGREHAIGKKIAESSKHPKLLFAPGNPGMAALGACYPVPADDIPGLKALALKEKADLTIVGPELPLVLGIVDVFQEAGLRVFGPSAAAARLEGSKAFAKDFMANYNIPTAGYATFTVLGQALDYLDKNGAPVVVKASGLAAGKGAIVCASLAEAKEAVNTMLGPDTAFGEAGKTVVLEQYMTGEEASILAVCDGEKYVLLPSSQDHKRIFDNDEGPNTGGMGAYAPAPAVTSDLLTLIETRIIIPTLKGMAAEGSPYKGVLYVGIMITAEGPKVVEFNCRLGDPEAQAVLPVYGGDLLALFDATLNGELTCFPPGGTRGSSAVIVLAAGAYPGDYEKGRVIEGLNSPDFPGSAHIIHAGTKLQNNAIVTSGGRVLGVVGQGDSLQAALSNAYQGVSCISFENMHYRKDIGQKGLARLSAMIHQSN